jgi:hypothetical protein
MAIYSKVVASAAVGATAGTYNSVGVITLRSDATMVYGFIVEAAETIATAATSRVGLLRITSSDLGIGPQVFMVPPYTGGDPATNIGFKAYRSEWVPFVKACMGKEQITVDYSQATPGTAIAHSVVVSCVYEAGSTKSSAEARAFMPFMAPISAGGTTNGAASVTTVAETSLGDLTIPAWASEIVGIKIIDLPNLAGAEERVGYVKLRSTIPNFDPQEWPLVFAIAPSLGTPVGKGVEIQDATPWMMGFPKVSQNETVSAYFVFNVAITTGDGVIVGLYWK